MKSDEAKTNSSASVRNGQGSYHFVVDLVGAAVNEEVAALDSDFGYELQVWKPPS